MPLVKWDIDYAHSSLDFTVRHLLVSKVRGRFTKWKGALEMDEQDLTRSRVEVEIDVASVIRNAPPARLYEDAISREHAAISDSGALIIRSGAKTGRSPLDKRIVVGINSSWWLILTLLVYITMCEISP